MSPISRRRLMLGAALGVCGCDIGAGSQGRIDGEWHRRALLDGHLSKWLAVAPTGSGLFHATFDRQWRRKPKPATPLTLQSRLIYAMASGFELTQDRRYLEAATRGADFLLERFHDPLHGGFYNSVAADGKVVSDTKQAYGHAFALFALAHMHRISGDERFGIAALRTWREIDARLRDPNGGLRAATARDFSFQAATNLSQNPVMHLFEALLALVDATGDTQARAGAVGVGNFAIYKLMQGSADGSAHIPEWYDSRWQALSTREKGGYVDLGHQFEWSHMLMSANRRGLPEIFAAVSDRLLQYALRVGYDDVAGGTFSTCFPDGTVARNKYWWPQAECLRALTVAASITGRADLWRRYEQTLQLVRQEFIDAEHGGWHTGSRELCARDGCPDEQPDPYHMTGMHMAALQAAAPR